MEDWRKVYFSKYSCKGAIINNQKGNLVVKGEIKNKSSDVTILYWASSPPDFNASFSGSGLPFANPEQAFDRSPNVGAVKTVNGKFEFKLFYPNSYYVGLGSLYIPPQVHIKICDGSKDEKYHSIKISEGIPFRTLTHPSPPSNNPRQNNLFYDNKNLQLRTQEQILRESAYPSTCNSNHKTPDNFWGKRPPV